MDERYRDEGSGDTRGQSDCSDPQKAEDDNTVSTPFLCTLTAWSVFPQTLFYPVL